MKACTAAGQTQEGWTALQEALAIRPTYGDRSWEAELYRLKGELLLMQDRRSGPSRGEHQVELLELKPPSHETVRELRAKSFELRAGMRPGTAAA